MKKTLWIAIAGVLVASVIAASAQEVLSANAVGYIKRSIPELGKLNTAAYPLNSMSSTTILFTNTSVAAEMPNLSWVYFWDSTIQQWIPSQKSGKGVWSGQALTKVVEPGEAFFLQTPSGQATPVEVTVTGEVPDDPTLQRAVPGGNNLGALGNPYPVDFAFATSALASNVANLSWVYFWDVAGQSWVPSQKSGKGAWSGQALTKTVQAGEGFFLQDAGVASTWTNAKPYTWP